MSNKTLANWVYRARKGQALVKRAPAQPASELEAELSRLRQENARAEGGEGDPKKSGGVLCEGVDVKYAWIEKHRHTYSTTMMCELLSVSRSGLNAARVRAPSKRSLDDEQLVEQIRHWAAPTSRPLRPAAHDAGGQRGAGHKVNHKRIGRLMREHGLQSHKRRRFRVVTTDSKHAHPVAPNVLERDFEATAPNQKWLADMTYVPTDEGWLYVALVLDLYARKLVGWAMSETMPQELTLSALDVALGWRDPDAGLVHHSDRGSQYAAKDYRKKLEARGITVSMSRKGDCWDNAPMESVNGTLEGRVRARRALRDPRAGTASDRRVHRLLQYRAAPFLAGQRRRRRNSSGAGAPRSNPKTKAPRL